MSPPDMQRAYVARLEHRITELEDTVIADELAYQAMSQRVEELQEALRPFVESEDWDAPRRVNLAYADPPYLGQGARHYDRPEWDEPARHRQLIEELCDTFPDGWALSASSPSLCILAPMMPRDIRVGAWCKSFGTFKRGVRPAYMWEPVFYRGGHNPPWEPHPPPVKGGKQTTPKDFIVEPIALRRGLTGAKPPKVCAWILDLLNFQPGDALDDLYPGTGIMGTVVAERAA